MIDELRHIALRALIVCVSVTWLVILWRADRNPAFKNFSVIGYFTTKEGYPDRPGTMEFGSWIALTLTLIVLVAYNRLTEWFVLVYAGLPALRAGQSAWQRANPTPPIPGTVTTESSKSVVTTAAATKGESP